MAQNSVIDYELLENIGLRFDDLMGFIHATESDKLVNIKTLMVYKDYQKVFTFAKSPYSFDDKHLLFSITKSVAAIAVGGDIGLYNQ